MTENDDNRPIECYCDRVDGACGVCKRAGFDTPHSATTEVNQRQEKDSNTPMTPDKFNPEIPAAKSEPLETTVERLLSASSDRLEEYEATRSDIHWKNDDAYRHIEKSYGELSNLYWLLRNDASEEELYREAADALNHILMALDIGSKDHTSSLETHNNK